MIRGTLVLALLLVQFVGIPFSLVFGHLPSPKEKRRALYLAFILFQLVALPAGAVLGRMLLVADWTGAPLPAYESTGTHAGDPLRALRKAALVALSMRMVRPPSHMDCRISSHTY